MEQETTKTTPALLDREFGTKVVFYPEVRVHILRDEKGIDVLDTHYRRVHKLSERKFIDIKF